MDVSAYNHRDSISVNRSPDDVYAIVSDIPRMGELSQLSQAFRTLRPSSQLDSGD